MNTVIPDSIEPYIGYKALAYRGGILTSPQQATPWPYGARLEAACNSNSSWNWQWVQRQLVEGEESRTLLPPPIPMQTTTTMVQPWQVHTFIPAHPQHPAPPGHEWVLQPTQHEAVTNQCTCGIYAVGSAAECLHYMGASSKAVIAKVALWGRVVRGTSGARGQYAYIQSIEFVQGLSDKEVVGLCERYGLELPESPPKQLIEALPSLEGLTTQVPLPPRIQPENVALAASGVVLVLISLLGLLQQTELRGYAAFAAMALMTLITTAVVINKS